MTKPAVAGGVVVGGVVGDALAAVVGVGVGFDVVLPPPQAASKTVKMITQNNSAIQRGMLLSPIKRIKNFLQYTCFFRALHFERHNNRTIAAHLRTFFPQLCDYRPIARDKQITAILMQTQ